MDELLQTVLRSQLLTRDELLEALREVPKSQRADPALLMDRLVALGKLTRYQAGKLLQGVALGMVIGPFRLLAPIGKGGMGTVFLVRDSRSQGLAALKVLPPGLARREARMVARFQREMEMCRKVAHPHVVWAYDVGEYRGAYYIAMEYVQGRTLARTVAEDGPLEMALAARLFSEVASGLDHAHRQGLIHRDLKPSNIMVTPRGHAKVLDLGLAMTHGEEVEDHMVVGGKGYIVGTMDYIAPEQTLDAAAVCPQVDLYSMGCSMYYALTGQPPFPGGTARDKVRRHRSEEPRPLEELRPGLPEGFVSLVRRLMSKRPEDRPESSAAAGQLLRVWARGEDEMDEPAVVEFDEEKLRAEAGLSYSVLDLPVVEAAEPEPPSRWKLAWVGLGVALGAVLAAVAWLLFGGR